MKIIKRYVTPSGKDPIDLFFGKLPDTTKIEVFTLLRRLETGEELSMPHGRSMTSLAKGLFELRVRDKVGHVRVFYYTKIKNTIFLVHAMRKKSRTIPEKDKKLIRKRISEIKGG